jgi:hypothetical protein
VLPDRRPTGRDEHVGITGLVNDGVNGVGAVGRATDINRHATPAGYGCCKRRAIRRDDLVSTRDGAGSDQFVAGGEDGDTRPASDQNRGVAA